MPEPAEKPIPPVEIEGVHGGNRGEVLRLKVAEEHLPYVSPVAEMLEGLGEDPAIECYAIRAGDGEVVGFFALDFDEERVGRYAQGRRPCGLRNYLISTKHQGRGYGRAAIPAILDLLRSEHAAASGLFLTVNRRNTAAISTYLAVGFRDTGRLYHSGGSGPQHVFHLPLDPAHEKGRGEGLAPS